MWYGRGIVCMEECKNITEKKQVEFREWNSLSTY